jgi:hypothetical protein
MDRRYDPFDPRGLTTVHTKFFLSLFDPRTLARAQVLYIYV